MWPFGYFESGVADSMKAGRWGGEAGVRPSKAPAGRSLGLWRVNSEQGRGVGGGKGEGRQGAESDEGDRLDGVDDVRHDCLPKPVRSSVMNSV